MQLHTSATSSHLIQPLAPVKLQSVRGRMLEGRTEEHNIAATQQQRCACQQPQSSRLIPLIPPAALQSVRGRMLEGRTEELMGLAKAVYRGRQAEGRPGSRSDPSSNA